MTSKKILRILLLSTALALALCVPALAANSDVSSVIQDTWTAAAGQIKTVVNTVVFPALALILTVAFFGKVALAYFACAPVAAM